MEIEEKLGRFSEELEKLAPELPCVKLRPFRGETTVFSSKFGGVPYFPKDEDYPTVREGALAGKPLRFLAQINFSELPRIKGFPESGILQFFAGCDGDDVYGADFRDMTNRNGFCVIFRENITDDESLLISKTPASEDGNYPFRGEFALKFGETEENIVSAEDFRFDRYACEAYNKAFGGKNVKAVFSYSGEPSIYGDDVDFCDALYELETLSGQGCKVGGYPHFTQEDPRRADNYKRFDTLLLQIDSEGDGEDEIMWGDCGVAGFFINSKDLQRRDFSEVLYNWDCC